MRRRSLGLSGALLGLLALASCRPLGLAGDAVVGTAQVAVGAVDLAL